jgi:hypothetical protein
VATRRAASLVAASVLATATDMLVVVSEIPNANCASAPSVASVFDTVHSRTAFGVSPSPCATTWVVVAAAVVLAKLPTIILADELPWPTSTASEAIATARRHANPPSTPSIRPIHATVGWCRASDSSRDRPLDAGQLATNARGSTLAA